ncbi:MAG: hypothetical protein FWH28_04355 [Clostridiales bacterium]|nr:hypothetical protein [Clostridiales bacterium]
MATPTERKNTIQTLRVYIDSIPPKRKRILLISAGVFLVLVIALSFLLLYRGGGSNYRVLYTGLDTVESIEVYDAINELGVTPQIDRRGQILVPESQYDYLLLQLAARGHPRSTLAYDVFLDNTGMTSTESDKKQIMIFQLQNRIQDTLHRISGVENAVVNLTIPDESNSVWILADPERSQATAGVMLNLGRNVEMYPEQVSAIKTLVAASVPKMLPENVSVINAATGLEMAGLEAGLTTVSGSLLAMQLEQTFQELVESNVRRILIPWYGEKGVFVVARITLDLDRMIQERYELLERIGPDGENEGGFVDHHEVEGIVEGVGNVAGIVGEENNTDVPTYLTPGGAAAQDYAHYYGSIDYNYGYLKTQIEGGSGRIKRGTVSVIVDERNLSEARRMELIDTISMAADIAPEFIALSALNPPPPPIIPVDPEMEAATRFWENLPLWVWLAALALLLLIVLLIVFFIYMRRRAARLAAEREEALLQEQETMMDEIERYKKELADAAMASVNVKDDAITNEIRQFAKDNPEITANLLRSWLKEGEEA